MTLIPATPAWEGKEDAVETVKEYSAGEIVVEQGSGWKALVDNTDMNPVGHPEHWKPSVFEDGTRDDGEGG
jgi:hypothetical protein